MLEEKAGDWDEGKHPRGEGGKFTESGGGGDSSSDEIPQASTGSESHAQQITSIVQSLDYDPAKVTIGEPQTTVIGGREYEVAAAFQNFSGGKIVVTSKDRDSKYLKGILAHEINHAKFEVVETLFSNQRLAMYREQHPDLNEDQAILKLVTEDLLPKVTSPEKYPVYAKLEPFFRDVAGMKRGAEISPYSKLNWQEYESKGKPFGFQYMKAINETLAEIARLDAGGYLTNDGKGLPKPWFDLYKTTRLIYSDNASVKLPVVDFAGAKQ